MPAMPQEHVVFEFLPGTRQVMSGVAEAQSDSETGDGRQRPCNDEEDGEMLLQARGDGDLSPGQMGRDTDHQIFTTPAYNKMLGEGMTLSVMEARITSISQQGVLPHLTCRSLQGHQRIINHLLICIKMQTDR